MFCIRRIGKQSATFWSISDLSRKDTLIVSCYWTTVTCKCFLVYLAYLLCRKENSYKNTKIQRSVVWVCHVEESYFCTLKLNYGIISNVYYFKLFPYLLIWFNLLQVSELLNKFWLSCSDIEIFLQKERKFYRIRFIYIF